jgi:hypothetical protein
MKVLINITELWSKLIEVEVPGGMDTETGVEWARNKVEQDYYDGNIDMTVDIDGRTDFDVLDPSSVSSGSTNPWDEKPRPEVVSDKSIEAQLSDFVEELYVTEHKKCGITAGDIAPEMCYQQDNAIHQLAQIIQDVLCSQVFEDDDAKYAETIKQLEEEADNKYC